MDFGHLPRKNFFDCAELKASEIFVDVSHHDLMVCEHQSLS